MALTAVWRPEKISAVRLSLVHRESADHTKAQYLSHKRVLVTHRDSTEDGQLIIGKAESSGNAFSVALLPDGGSSPCPDPL